MGGNMTKKITKADVEALWLRTMPSKRTPIDIPDALKAREEVKDLPTNPNCYEERETYEFVMSLKDWK
jgi:hypothetical protein